MSTHRMANQKVVSPEFLTHTGRSVPRVVSDLVERLLLEIDQKTEPGQEVAWDTLRIAVEPEVMRFADHPGPPNLRMTAHVDVHQNDIVAGLSAIALAEARAEQDAPHPLTDLTAGRTMPHTSQ